MNSDVPIYGMYFEIVPCFEMAAFQNIDNTFQNIDISFLNDMPTRQLTQQV